VRDELRRRKGQYVPEMDSELLKQLEAREAIDAREKGGG
jgi:hypothetical protein